MNTPVTFYVRSGLGTVTRCGESFTDTVDTATRTPQQRSGWQWVAYRGKRYQLHGGIRTPLCISLDNPIKKNGQ